MKRLSATLLVAAALVGCSANRATNIAALPESSRYCCREYAKAADAASDAAVDLADTAKTEHSENAEACAAAADAAFMAEQASAAAYHIADEDQADGSNARDALVVALARSESAWAAARKAFAAPPRDPKLVAAYADALAKARIAWEAAQRAMQECDLD